DAARGDGRMPIEGEGFQCIARLVDMVGAVCIGHTVSIRCVAGYVEDDVADVGGRRRPIDGVLVGTGFSHGCRLASDCMLGELKCVCLRAVLSVIRSE